MARMHPEKIDGYEGATDGERRVFCFLREAAKPHKDFTCWYQPTLSGSGKEPDFIIFGARLGLLILEVKDWSSRQIISYDPHQFTILVSGKEEIKTNPDKQAKGYVNALKERLSEVPELLSDRPAHRGQMKIPIGRMVVFPNISVAEYAASEFKWAIEPERVLLKEDLDPAGEFLLDTSGQKLREKFSKTVPFHTEDLNHKEIEKLHSIIWPEGKIELPMRQGAGRDHFRNEVAALDETQARLALRLGSGNHIVKGPAGSGKTLVLVHRCCYLRRYRPSAERILLVCFNIALVNYLRRLIQEKGVGIGESEVYVCHFYELCSNVMRENIEFQKQDQDYYTIVAQEALERITKGKSGIHPFDAVLVDEGQDFDEEMVRVLLSLLKPGGDLVVSLDSFQSLYGRKPAWKNLGLKADFRTHHLKSAYRCTCEIFDFTQRFIGQTPEDTKQLTFLPPDFGFHGEKPALQKFDALEQVQDFVATEIQEVTRSGEYKRSEIAIIYDDKVYGPDGFAYAGRALPESILTKLAARGIPAYWVSEDVRSKQLYDITTDREKMGDVLN